MEQVGVEMQDIELRGPPTHCLQLHHLVRQRVVAIRIETKRLVTAGHELRSGSRVAAGEQGDVMTLTDQFFSQIGDDTLGATV